MTSLLFALNQLIEWPAKSLGDLKSKVLHVRMETLTCARELSQNLWQQRDLNQSAVRAMRTRVEACVEKTGGHDEGHWG